MVELVFLSLTGEKLGSAQSVFVPSNEENDFIRLFDVVTKKFFDWRVAKRISLLEFGKSGKLSEVWLYLQDPEEVPVC